MQSVPEMNEMMYAGSAGAMMRARRLFHGAKSATCSLAATLLLLGATAAEAQTAADVLAPKKENDGTDPTSPVRFAKFSYEHLDLSLPESLPGNNSNTFAMEFQQPFGRTAFKFKLPITSVDTLGNGSFGLGDVSAKVSHVASVTKTHGIVLGAEMIFNTADRPELGTGKTVFKPSFIYAFFLNGGHIFAPALVHSVSIAGDANRENVNATTIDFYFVPKLANPKFYMTLDPALTQDWHADKFYLITALTVGYTVGPMMGGTGQVFVKPSVGLGGDKPTGWGIQAGFQLINF
jgi:hypothetical protein